MKILTLTLWMAVVGSVLMGCGQGGTQTSNSDVPASNNSQNNTNDPVTEPVTAISNPAPTTNKTRALVYNGPGACPENCAQSARDMALRSGLIPTYVGPNDINSGSSAAEIEAMFKDVAVWIQPGGVSSTVMQNMSSAFVAALRNYVSTGGGYVGFCAGAFSSTAKVGTTRNNGYNIFPGRTVLYPDSPTSASVLSVNWNGVIRKIYWEGGPYLTDLPAGAEAIAYYPNGQIATARSQYGLGKVFITGLHPEAPQSWRTYYGLNDSDGTDFDLVDQMISWVK